MSDTRLENREQAHRPASPAQTEEAWLVENIDTHGQTGTTQSQENSPLPWLRDDEIDDMQSRWNAIQVEFVDNPRASVEKADALIADAVDRIKNVLYSRRAGLNEEWSKGGDCTTEDLRVALQNYRSFMNRLLAF